MGKAKQTKKFAEVKRLVSRKDQRLKENTKKYEEHEKKRMDAM